jgi:predicted transcriptional regulator
VNAEGRVKVKLLVSLQPGLHLRELQRQMGVSFSSIRYHVDKLAKRGEIERFEDRGYSRLYPVGTDDRDKILFSLARRKSDHKILACFLMEGGLSRQRLINLTGLSKSMISEHLANLLELGIVRKRVGGEGIFELIDSARVDDLISRYPLPLKLATRRFIDLWDF